MCKFFSGTNSCKINATKTFIVQDKKEVFTNWKEFNNMLKLPKAIPPIWYTVTFELS